MRSKHFDQDQVRDFVKRAKAPWGSGWGLLGPYVQQLAIEAAAFTVIRAQHRESVAVDAMDSLLSDMLIEAGLAEKESE